MEKEILWDKEITESLEQVSEQQLDDLLNVLEFIQKENIDNYVCRKTLEDENFWEWVYAKEKIELVDVKKELCKRIEKAKEIELDTYEKKRHKVGELQDVKTLILCFNKENIYCISNIEEYYIGLRGYLGMQKKDDFCNDVRECFANIFFSDRVESSVNTLNRKFEEIREEIIQHLSQLNDYKDKFSKLLSENNSFNNIARAFSNDTGIECSPQASRKGIRELQEKYYNDESGQEEVITCELHTKFKKFNINRERQDRIYFFPGKQGIKEGRVIVIHIGTHL